MSIFFGIFSGKRPDNLGVKEGRLSPCPDKPNCVCSQQTELRLKSETTAPLPFINSCENTLSIIKAYAREQIDWNIITETENYLHIECKSAFFGFIDDLEIYCDETEKMTQVRSASRLGYSDLGVNKIRIEKLRDYFTK